MRWLAVFCGVLIGLINYALLALACKKLLAGKTTALPWMLGAAAFPATGLVACAIVFPILLAWFGGACAASLILVAIVHAVLRQCRVSAP
ncbi:MAG: hypothetical protein LBQ33_05770 [Oscillospiraceae bacterium]|jgi:hypothetical protein|nr:hypothetical protein [Oscillospiraceae bacterium]